MVELLKIYERLRQVLSEEQARVVTEVFAEAFTEGVRNVLAPLSERLEHFESALAQTQGFLVQTTQTLAELAHLLNTLSSHITELSAAQRRAEERLARLEEAVTALAEAQRHFEERMVIFEQRMAAFEERLARLEEAVTALAEAQRHFEERMVIFEQRMAAFEERLARLEEAVTALAEAQRHFEERLARLEESQQRTEKRLSSLEKHVGGITHTIGYALENAAYRALPRLLQQDYGIQVLEALRRETLRLPDGTVVEVNILGKIKHGDTVKTLVGESKSQLSRRHIRRFLRSLRRLREKFGEIFPLMVAHAAAEPDLKEHARAHGVAVYFSYEFNEPILL